MSSAGTCEVALAKAEASLPLPQRTMAVPGTNVSIRQQTMAFREACIPLRQRMSAFPEAGVRVRQRTMACPEALLPSRQRTGLFREAHLQLSQCAAKSLGAASSSAGARRRFWRSPPGWSAYREVPGGATPGAPVQRGASGGHLQLLEVQLLELEARLPMRRRRLREPKNQLQELEFSLPRHETNILGLQ